jgi:hypothetical protein
MRSHESGLTIAISHNAPLARRLRLQAA